MALPQPPAAPSCYRHPGREAWRSCTRCQRVACNDCLVQASIGSQCVECLKQAKPAVSTRVKDGLARRPALVSYVLIGINAVVFLLTTATDAQSVGGRTSRLLYDLALVEGYVRDEPYRLLTSGFIHFGLVHLLFNMFALYSLGPAMEAMIGRTKFLLVYLASLFAGGLGAIVLTRALGAATGGASGAVFGMFGAYAMAMWKQGINPLQTQIGGVLIFNLLYTFLRPNISVGGHLGGLIGGAVCALAIFPWRMRRTDPRLAYAVPAAVILVSIGLSLALVQQIPS